ncbi:MAG: type II toxin-antitoxin system VapC family toxin [Candidatus Xenobia bacterium]
MARYLLDTSVFSQPIKDHPDPRVKARWERAGDNTVCTSAICLAELLSGLQERQSRKYWRRYQQILEHRLPILPLDEAVTTVYAELNASTRRRGEPRPVLDLLIAATARHHGLIVATLNLKDFGGLEGVAVEDWSLLP